MQSGACQKPDRQGGQDSLLLKYQVRRLLPLIELALAYARASDTPLKHNPPVAFAPRDTLTIEILEQRDCVFA